MWIINPIMEAQVPGFYTQETSTVCWCLGTYIGKSLLRTK